ncbi:MAG: ATP-binding protein, partial [Lewinella sp.]|nr:ATP-binding protein [Lewinella sp.]
MTKIAIQRLIAGNKTQKALDALKQAIGTDTALMNQLVLIESQLTALKEAERVNTEEPVQLTRSKNKIHKALLELLDDLFSDTSKSTTILLTPLPVLEDKLIGREEELMTLHKTLHDSQRVVLMNGMGGIGKTTTAIAYANRYKEEYRYIIWIEQLDDLTTDLSTNTKLLTNLGLQASENAEATAIQILETINQLPGKSLLIIDNATEEVSRFKKELPRTPHWQVLITSRQELSFATLLPLDFLSPSKALELFFSHYDRDRNEQLAQKIIRTVDYHTLTIEILAKTAQRRRLKLQVLINLLEERGIAIGRKVDFSVGHSREEKIAQLFPYLKAVFGIDASMSEKEIWLLKQYVALPSLFIRLDFLAELLQIDDEEDETEYDDLTATLDNLKEKGWLIYDEEQDAFKIHRIVQEVMLDHLQPNYDDLKTLVEGISEKLAIDDSKDNPVNKFPFLTFGERIDQLIAKDTAEAEYANFLNALGYVHKHYGNYPRSMNLRERSLAIYTILSGEESNVARLQSNLALIYKDLGRYEPAAELMEKALDSALSNFGEMHPEISNRQSNLAMIYRDLRRYESAAELMGKALDSDLVNFGETHPFTAIRQSNLAMIYRDLRRYESAAEL